MKRIAILAALLLAASCSVTRDRATLVTFASFSDYPDMWISPNDCPMVHTALGVLEIDVIPAIKRYNPKDGIYSNAPSTVSRLEKIYYDELHKQPTHHKGGRSLHHPLQGRRAAAAHRMTKEGHLSVALHPQ